MGIRLAWTSVAISGANWVGFEFLTVISQCKIMEQDYWHAIVDIFIY